MHFNSWHLGSVHSPLWFPCCGLVKQSVMLVSVVNLTESGDTWEMCSWACLWEILLVILRWEDTPTMGGAIPWLGSWAV